jgi:hypothetical protein
VDQNLSYDNPEIIFCSSSHSVFVTNYFIWCLKLLFVLQQFFCFCLFSEGFLECPKSYVFRGDKDISPQEVQKHLNLTSRDPRGGAGGVAARRFLLPIAECEFTFNAILDNLQKDQWPTPTDHR